jgi:hypothetical protein
MLLRGCDKQLTNAEHWSNPGFRIGADPTIGLRKVRNFRGEQKDLERSAKDSESLVCQVSETL